MYRNYLTLILFFVQLSFMKNINAQEVIFEKMLIEMTDRSSIARFPHPSFTLGQSSSYDRKSVKPGKDGWYANKDNSNFIRKEKNQGRIEYVLLDEEGPGAIVRFWATFGNKNGENGVLRFYFDGAGTPELEGDPRMLLGGAELVGYPLSASEPQQSTFNLRGHNL